MSAWAPSPLIKWRLRRGATLKRGPDHILTVQAERNTEVRLPLKTATIADALWLLRTGADEAQFAEAVGDNVDAAILVFHHLGRLRKHGFLVAELWSGRRRFATLLPRSSSFDLSKPRDTGLRWQLSRFAYLHCIDGDLVLECPEAPCTVLVHSRVLMSWIHQASTPTDYEPDTVKAGVICLLATLGFFVDPEGNESAAQRTWEFHDRLFHRRVRLFEDFRPHGGTYRFRAPDGIGAHACVPSPPAVRPAYGGEVIALPTPHSRASRPIYDVMENRHSKRTMGVQPVPLCQVAELLYRVARTRGIRESSLQDLLDRPYPSGGAIHELEFYLAVGQCDGLASGFYHYRGSDHMLTRLVEADEPAKDMVADCAKAWGQPEHPPHCVVVLSSRLPRLAWKYEAVAYKLSLLNAGVVTQSLYLVCTDLGLNGAAMGSGRPDLFAAATGNSSWEETSIVEFGFGSPPQT